jgi:hypothetical protein
MESYGFILMLKPLKELGKPDRHYLPDTPLDHVIGQRIEDLHALMSPLELLSSVPGDVRRQFDTARNGFVGTKQTTRSGSIS